MINESNPVFVKIDKYQEILSIVDVVNKKITTVKQLLSEIEDLKAKEDEEVMNWEKTVDEIMHKMGNVQDQLIQD